MSKFNQPLGGNDMPRFGGPATMMRLPAQETAEGLDACFVGIPLDIGTSNRSGTRLGPRQIRDESRMLRPYNMATRAAPFDSLQVADIGDVPINTPASARRMIEDLTQTYGEKYAKGPAYLKRLEAIEAKLKANPKDAQAAADLAGLIREASLANPLLDFDDVDGNGLPDLFTTNFSSDTNTLHLDLDHGVKRCAGLNGKVEITPRRLRKLVHQGGIVDAMLRPGGLGELSPSRCIGAVIMKITSSTSITSMYGTTLISAMGRRRPRGLTGSIRDHSSASRCAWRCRMLENSSLKLS